MRMLQLCAARPSVRLRELLRLRESTLPCSNIIAQSPEFDCNGGITALGRHTLRVIDCLLLLLLLLLLLHTAFVCGPAFNSDCTLPSISGSDGGSSAIRN